MAKQVSETFVKYLDDYNESGGEGKASVRLHGYVARLEAVAHEARHQTQRGAALTLCLIDLDRLAGES